MWDTLPLWIRDLLAKLRLGRPQTYLSTSTTMTNLAWSVTQLPQDGGAKKGNLYQQLQDINCARSVDKRPKHTKHWCGEKLSSVLTPPGPVSVWFDGLDGRSTPKIDVGRPRSNVRNIWFSYGDSTHESGIKSASSQHRRAVRLWSGASCHLPVIK